VKTSLIIAVKNEASTISHCLESVFSQELQCELEVLVIDSGSTDGTLDLVKKFNVKLMEIPAREFQHARTRNLGASITTGDILVFLSADAVPISRSWLSNLTAPLHGNDGIAASYGRQVPRDGASYNTKTALANIYPDEPLVKRIEDLPKLGLRTYHFSNANSAYLRSVWEQVQFAENLIVCEDVDTARSILEKGFAIAYVPSAAVRHSHNYGLRRTLKRYFDIGVSYQRMGLFRAGNVGRGIAKGGLQHAVAEAKGALREGGIGTLFTSTALNAAKYLGLSLGRVENKIPKPIKKKLSLYSNFWDLE